MKTAPLSIVFEARLRIGWTKLLVEVARDAVRRNGASSSSAPSTPFVIEPPDTLEMRFELRQVAELVQAPDRADVEQHRAVAAAGEAERDAPLELLRLGRLDGFAGGLL